MKIIIFLLFILIPLYIQGQVTIGTGEAPDTDALLELKENVDGIFTKGLLLPRIKLSSQQLSFPLSAHVKGMTVFNIDGTNLSEGLYYNDGTRWIRPVPLNTIFFYAPSIVVPTNTWTYYRM